VKIVTRYLCKKTGKQQVTVEDCTDLLVNSILYIVITIFGCGLVGEIVNVCMLDEWWHAVLPFNADAISFLSFGFVVSVEYVLLGFFSMFIGWLVLESIATIILYIHKIALREWNKVRNITVVECPFNKKE
jgi:hypothetical protein